LPAPRLSSRLRLTLPSSGRSKGRFAPFGPPLMSNVRPDGMQLVLFLLIALAPSLGALALVGHRAAAQDRLSRYVLLSSAAWLASSMCLYGLVLWSPGVAGVDNRSLAAESGGFAALAAVCFVPFALAGSILYCWGRLWSREGHFACALSGEHGGLSARGSACVPCNLRVPGQLLVSARPNPSIERTSQRPLRALCAAAHVER
jgi:hypothetical protein